MAKVNGTVMLIQSGTDTLLWTKSCTLNVEVDLPDGTTKDSLGWADHINGLRSWSIDFDGAWDVSGSGMTPNEMIAIIIGRTADATVKFGTSAAFATGWTGTATVKNLSVSANMEDVTTFSGSLVGNGALAAI
jgi:predicted secreted protein